MKIAITGHRKIEGHYFNPHNPTPAWQRVDLAIENTLNTILPEPPNYPSHTAISGMALGVDQLYARLALQMGLKLHAYIPFIEQASRWPPASIKEWHHLISQAQQVTTVCPPGYAAWKMQARNEAMVQACDHLIAVWDGHPSGGTYNCLQFSIQQWYPEGATDSFGEPSSSLEFMSRITWIRP